VRHRNPSIALSTSSVAGMMERRHDKCEDDIAT